MFKLVFLSLCLFSIVTFAAAHSYWLSINLGHQHGGEYHNHDNVGNQLYVDLDPNANPAPGEPHDHVIDQSQDQYYQSFLDAHPEDQPRIWQGAFTENPERRADNPPDPNAPVRQPPPNSDPLVPVKELDPDGEITHYVKDPATGKTYEFIPGVGLVKPEGDPSETGSPPDIPPPDQGDPPETGSPPDIPPPDQRDSREEGAPSGQGDSREEGAPPDQNEGLSPQQTPVSTPVEDPTTSGTSQSISGVGTVPGAQETETPKPEVLSQRNEAPSPPVWIPDESLKKAVRTVLKLNADEFLTQRHLLNLRSLKATKLGIISLSGLEHAVNLKSLSIGGNQIQNLRPLSNLRSLTNLYIGDNRIKSIHPLANLANLQRLGMLRNQVNDISVLAGLVNLEYLRLAGNPITDTAPLTNLPKLSDVDVEVPSFIPDLNLRAAVHKALGIETNSRLTTDAMKNLTKLNAPKLGITDLTGLEYAANLKSLSIMGNQITDLTPLSNLTRLTHLYMGGNRISNINPLTSLITLQRLRAQNNQIRDIGVLIGFVNLEYLRLAGNPITDTASLTNLPKLSDVDIEISSLPQASDALQALCEELGGTYSKLADGLSGVCAFGAPSKNNSLFILDQVRPEQLDPAVLKAQLDIWRSESDGSQKYLRAIAWVESILAAMRPEKTELLANYPNPFNPETWIPFHLANSSDVTITIYDMRGTTVRSLELGHQQEGYYTSRNRAAYWDGRNDLGENVASGIYFYQLQADNLSLLRKMIVLK